MYKSKFPYDYRPGALDEIARHACAPGYVVEPNVRRAFAFPSELWTTLEENQHSFLIVEHRRNEWARDIAGHIAQAMKQASREASSCTLPYWTVDSMKADCPISRR